MKTSRVRSAIGSTLLASTLAAALVAMSGNAIAENNSSGPGTMGGGMMMSDGDTKNMQEQMRKMQMQMDEIRKTTDPEKRDRLIDEHMQSMQEGMKMMRGMGGSMMHDMMMGGEMPSGKSMQGGGMSKSGDMMGRMNMMEERMDMMQMMMEQMAQSRQFERRNYGPQK
ncbi:MAG: hypothetical protein HY941_12555 [Gammaproteobacteria bacterium]|nr:hypothetical protein [Gammaproteobacteria bacterium]